MFETTFSLFGKLESKPFFVSCFFKATHFSESSKKKKIFEFPEKMMIVFVFIVQNCYENSRTVIEHLFLWSCYDLQAGPRICLGKDFAYRQMKIMAIALLRFFRFKLADETKNVTYRTMFTLHINGGLHLYAVPRTGFTGAEM